MISSVRIVQSIDIGQKLLHKLETGMLGPLRVMAKKKAAVKSLEIGTVYGTAFLVYSTAFWYGSIVVAKGLSVGYVLTMSPRCFSICHQMLTHKDFRQLYQPFLFASPESYRISSRQRRQFVTSQTFVFRLKAALHRCERNIRYQIR